MSVFLNGSLSELSRFVLNEHSPDKRKQAEFQRRLCHSNVRFFKSRTHMNEAILYKHWRITGFSWHIRQTEEALLHRLSSFLLNEFCVQQYIGRILEKMFVFHNMSSLMLHCVNIFSKKRGNFNVNYFSDAVWCWNENQKYD